VTVQLSPGDANLQPIRQKMAIMNSAPIVPSYDLGSVRSF